MIPEPAYTEALRRIARCRETGEDLLDLGDLSNRLTHLPPELGGLTHLRTLALGSEKPTRTAGGIQWTFDTGESSTDWLQCVSINSDIWARVPTGLQDVSALSHLVNLTSLSLEGCESLQDVSTLSHLANLTSLSLDGCESLQDVSAISQLVNLTSLSLRRCRALQDVSAISQLVNLASLDLGDCRSLAFAPVRNLLKTKIQILRLSGTAWTDLPEALFVNGRFDNDLNAVRAYCADLDAGAEEDAEVKVYILGNGRIGKTQLIRRLNGEPYDPDGVKTTHGVRLVLMDFEVPHFSHGFRLNLWDFGGQELYHGSHALFLRGQGVFLLLWTPETESGSHEDSGLTLTNHSLSYWFDYLREMVGVPDREGHIVVNYPVLLIQSRCESREQERDPPSPLPSEKEFSYLRRLTFAAAPVEDGESRNLDELFLQLKKAIRWLYIHRRQPMLGVGRKKVRESLRAMQHAKTPRTLTFADFERECEKAKNVSSPGELLTYLHRTGVVFHNVNLFGGRIVVDQTWALDAVYTIFTRQDDLQNSIRSKRGRFTRDDLDRFVWMGRYTVEEQRQFLTMMEQCHICFRVSRVSGGHDWSPDAEWEYVAPEKLEDWNDDHEASYSNLLDREPEAAAVAEYCFLHQGIVRSFLAQIGHHARERADFWRFGCCFYERRSRSRVLVQCHSGRRGDGPEFGTISMRVWGTNAHELVASLVRMLERMPLGSQPNIRWTRGTPNPNRDDRPQPAFDIALRTVFVSYRHSESDDLVRDLVVSLTRENWQVVWDQTHLETGGSISDFVNDVRRIPFLLTVWSRTYHESRWCLSELFGWLEGQQCRFDRLTTQAVAVVLDGATIDQDSNRTEHARLLREWCNNRSRRAASMAPRDLELLQLMQSWQPRFARVLERLSDRLLLRGEAYIRAGGFRAIVDRLNALFDSLPNRL